MCFLLYPIMEESRTMGEYRNKENLFCPVWSAQLRWFIPTFIVHSGLARITCGRKAGRNAIFLPLSEKHLYYKCSSSILLCCCKVFFQKSCLYFTLTFSFNSRSSSLPHLIVFFCRSPCFLYVMWHEIKHSILHLLQALLVAVMVHPSHSAHLGPYTRTYDDAFNVW